MAFISLCQFNNLQTRDDYQSLETHVAKAGNGHLSNDINYVNKKEQEKLFFMVTIKILYPSVFTVRLRLGRNQSIKKYNTLVVRGFPYHFFLLFLPKHIFHPDI
jgi:hypothetical protein